MTAFTRTLFCATGLFAMPIAAAAQTQVGNAQMVSVTGTCGKLVVGDRELTGACSAKLLNVAYPDGRVGFYFVLNDGRIVTFSGMDGDNPTPDTDVIHLDKVIMSRTDTPDRPDVFVATGTCGFGNPTKGPMTVACDGTLSQGGVFSAAFTTDGKPPT
ncbi:hypothetical protein [Shinella zoogloeoides]|uniref:hypothetical protein n=1 Tax=Shinella zoogloeoides TaxID=352475 RepID=UPI00273DE4D7|nr:hypothetical protein [Shinella zoogloeoides]WLR93832.1 hypothetical protein Q9316_06490 [Shinella zoogloeoides]